MLLRFAYSAAVQDRYGQRVGIFFFLYILFIIIDDSKKKKNYDR